MFSKSIKLWVLLCFTALAALAQSYSISASPNRVEKGKYFTLTINPTPTAASPVSVIIRAAGNNFDSDGRPVSANAVPVEGIGPTIEGILTRQAHPYITGFFSYTVKNAAGVESGSTTIEVIGAGPITPPAPACTGAIVPAGELRAGQSTVIGLAPSNGCRLDPYSYAASNGSFNGASLTPAAGGPNVFTFITVMSKDHLDRVVKSEGTFPVAAAQSQNPCVVFAGGPTSGPVGFATFSGTSQNCLNATDYRVSINAIENIQPGLSFNFTTAGSYSVYVSASTSNGRVYSSPFTYTAKAPEVPFNCPVSTGYTGQPYVGQNVFVTYSVPANCPIDGGKLTAVVAGGKATKVAEYGFRLDSTDRVTVNLSGTSDGRLVLGQVFIDPAPAPPAICNFLTLSNTNFSLPTGGSFTVTGSTCPNTVATAYYSGSPVATTSNANGGFSIDLTAPTKDGNSTGYVLVNNTAVWFNVSVLPDRAIQTKLEELAPDGTVKATAYLTSPPPGAAVSAPNLKRNGVRYRVTATSVGRTFGQVLRVDVYVNNRLLSPVGNERTFTADEFTGYSEAGTQVRFIPYVQWPEGPTLVRAGFANVLPEGLNPRAPVLIASLNKMAVGTAVADPWEWKVNPGSFSPGQRVYLHLVQDGRVKDLRNYWTDLVLEDGVVIVGGTYDAGTITLILPNDVGDAYDWAWGHLQPDVLISSFRIQ